MIQYLIDAFLLVVKIEVGVLLQLIVWSLFCVISDWVWFRNLKKKLKQNWDNALEQEE